MDSLKIFEDVGGKGKNRKIKLPITEDKQEEPMFIQAEDFEDDEE